MATLGVPAFGYGMRYQFGMFRQAIRDGARSSSRMPGCRAGDHWFIQRPDVRYPVGFGGAVQGPRARGAGCRPRRWRPTPSTSSFPATARTASPRCAMAGAGDRVARLRRFSRGEFHAAAAPRARAEAINWVLYPDDSTPAGRELRLKQEFLLVSASLQDIVARHIAEHGRLTTWPTTAAIHLNDTHRRCRCRR